MTSPRPFQTIFHSSKTGVTAGKGIWLFEHLVTLRVLNLTHAVLWSAKHLSTEDGTVKEALLWNTEMPAVNSREGLLLRTQEHHQSAEAVSKRGWTTPVSANKRLKGALL